MRKQAQLCVADLAHHKIVLLRGKVPHSDVCIAAEQVVSAVRHRQLDLQFGLVVRWLGLS